MPWVMLMISIPVSSVVYYTEQLFQNHFLTHEQCLPYFLDVWILYKCASMKGKYLLPIEQLKAREYPTKTFAFAFLMVIGETIITGAADAAC